ncbi:MAG: GerMN domain-containing protein [Treponema sp.]|uniref:GerMN domain-containing protein n=1 Tax=Treponema sp. TaxID=166 RepID=UPI0025D3921E|nr:GerMN domain-containing protein [Treponema sp.]MBQ9280666.1 GerMN domain-containing protein [Treponema sp.]
MSEKGKKNKKKTGLGLALWILAFLIILIVFLVKQEEIKENFDKSGASALIEKKIGKDIFDDKKDGSEETVIQLKKEKPVEAVKAAPAEVEPQLVERKESQTPIAQTETKSQPVAVETEKHKTQPQPEKRQPVQQETKTASKTQAEEKSKASVEVKTATQTQAPASTVSNTTKAMLCFVAIDSDGLVVRKEVSRSVSKDAPLVESLKELLKGPTATESKTGCQTYIPAGTHLIGASIKNGIAYLNFSEEFQFNDFGPMGLNVQLMQIVYTATSFSSVKKVQFLIDGKTLDYLSEGVWIGSPRGRNDY